jgi:hypothetical protein
VNKDKRRHKNLTESQSEDFVTKHTSPPDLQRGSWDASLRGLLETLCAGSHHSSALVIYTSGTMILTGLLDTLCAGSHHSSALVIYTSGTMIFTADVLFLVIRLLRVLIK